MREFTPPQFLASTFEISSLVHRYATKALQPTLRGCQQPANHMSTRPTKRLRIATEGGANHDFVLLPDDDYSDIFSRDATLRPHRTTGVDLFHINRLVVRSDKAWAETSWAPPDDESYALDPDGAWYDEILTQEVLTESITPTQPPKKEKKKKSQVSRRPHVIWKKIHRSTYLDEILRISGRADFQGSPACPDCLTRKNPSPGVPEYRCNECFLPDLTCKACCVKRHRTNPLHRIQQWSGTHFTPVSLQSLGLTIQLHHASMRCENPSPCHSSMLILHTNGVHKVSINYCNCSRAIPQHIQLLRRRFYPASQRIVKTCATFELLDLLHKFSLTTKASIYDFYRGLEKLTDSTGLQTPKSRYRSLSRMNLQWRHLKLLKWGGRAHDPAGVDATQPGQLAVRCPSCPYPDINLPDGWENADPGVRFLYMLFVCMDANFRLKNQLVSSYSQDPGLGIGWAYMVPREPYEQFIKTRTNDQDISTCVGFQALAQANTRFSQGLRTTGVGGVFCGRSEMVLPLGLGNLQKGERYANMDYVFISAIHTYMLLLILISYDVACQWFKNLFSRLEDAWPPEPQLPSVARLIPAIPKLHEPMHNTANHQVFSLNYIPGVGLSDLECPERVWSAHNALGNSTKTQGPGSRHDVLDDHFGFWNWQKFVGMGRTLLRKYRAAVAARNIQNEGHRGLTTSLGEDLVQAWEDMCVAWEQDTFPKQKKNPYNTEGSAITEAQAKKELATDEEKRLSDGGAVLHSTSAPAFVSLGLEIEETQRRLRRLAQNISTQATARKEGGLTEQRNQLTARIRAWEQLLPIYLPGLLQYQMDRRAAGEEDAIPEHAEDHPVWLPSQLPCDNRQRICVKDLPGIEEKLRTAQCYDALRNLRHILKIKTRLIKFKNKNVRGQRDGTRSRAVIDRVHEKARVAVEKYRAARAAKLNLTGPGEWEKELRVLYDADVRGYQDPNQLQKSQGRQGTLEDAQVEDDVVMQAPSNPGQTDDFTLLVEERARRDGTGETRRTLSWIWITGQVTDDPNNANDDILRAEWAKSRARAARAREEVLLLREEMRRTLVFLAWKSDWWMKQAARRAVDGALAEALDAYCHSQSALYSALAVRFRELWQNPLNDIDAPLDTNAANAHAIPLIPSSKAKRTTNGVAEGGQNEEDNEDFDELENSEEEGSDDDEGSEGDSSDDDGDEGNGDSTSR
ncbi:hypothetical protein CVT26_006159 [Gymnopilus dilepis]|uniref:CxC2-like cysteine cluster KDZ transposase-associated domain-containing protein n=1 Tax=Gymnopilus dilepis TaxID=231916 RepID=A0A409WGE4_9AGAR|nr:hypothetical protein CVT26_006159 [Gymnopilus dilepis]